MAFGSSDSTSAERARWLAELSEALDEACALVTRFAFVADNPADAFDLYLRIEAARLEVQALRVSRSVCPRDENAPEWTDLSRSDGSKPDGG